MYQNRIDRLRQSLREHNLDSLWVSNLPNIRYLSGFTGSTAKVLITEKQAFLIVDFRYVTQAELESSHMTILKVGGSDYLTAYRDAIKNNGALRLGFEASDVSFADFDELSRDTQVDWLATSGIVEELRKIKDADEARRMKRACKITSDALTETLAMIRPGMTELDVLAELEYRMRKAGGGIPAFDTIVASGVRSSMPHAHPTDKVIQDGDYVTIDCGSTFEGYCADTTRTIVVGNPDDRQKEIWNAVREAMERGIAAVRPGVSCKSVDAVARDYLASLGFAEYFGHGLGHGVGIEVHEEPRLNTRCEDILQPGMMVTVEPGVYIPEWGGVRLEQLVMVTENGAEVFTDAPISIVAPIK